MPDAIMKTVGRYEILREVGRGGMAMVYLARQTDLDRFVALKELGAFHASDPSFAQRFLRESRVAGSLSHPNIVTVHDYFEHDGTPYIAMEYVERGSLRPYVGRMNLAQIGGVLEGLLAGLTNAEAQGIVHRDLKPENLMVTADGRVKIADFGIAKATTKMQTGAFLTATGTTVGTPTYMAPEQAMAQDIGPWTDLYSVGCMAFEMFTGNVPFHDSDAPMAILLRHVNEPIAPVKSIRPEVDQRISDWIERLLVKEPTARTQNANDAWDDFEEIVLGLLGPRWRREARLVESARPSRVQRRQAADAGAVPRHDRRRRRLRGVQVLRLGRARVGHRPVGRAADVHAAAVGVDAVDPGADRRPADADALAGRPGAGRAAGPRADRRDRLRHLRHARAAAADRRADRVAGRGRSEATRRPSSRRRRPSRARARRSSRPRRPASPRPRASATPLRPPRRSPRRPPISRRRPRRSRRRRRSRPTSRREPSRPPTSEPKPDAAAGRGRRAGAGRRRSPYAAPPVTPAPQPSAPLVADTMMPQALPEPPTKTPKPPKPPAGDDGGRPQVGRARGSRRRRRHGRRSSRSSRSAAVAAARERRVAARRRRRPPPRPAPPCRSRPTASRCRCRRAGPRARATRPRSPASRAPSTVGGPKGGDGRRRQGRQDAPPTRRCCRTTCATASIPEAETVDIGDGKQALLHDGVQGRRQDRRASSRSRPPRASPRWPASPRPRRATRSPPRCRSPRATSSRSARARPTAKDVEKILGRLESREKSAARDLNNAGKRATQVAATSQLSRARTAAPPSRCAKLNVSPADAMLRKQHGRRARRRRRRLPQGRRARARAKDRAGYQRQGSRALSFQGDMKTALAGLSEGRLRPAVRRRRTPPSSRACRRSRRTR